MVLMDRAQLQRRFKELKAEHIRALSTGDLETLERVQAELAELMKREVRAPSRCSAVIMPSNTRMQYAARSTVSLAASMVVLMPKRYANPIANLQRREPQNTRRRRAQHRSGISPTSVTCTN